MLPGILYNSNNFATSAALAEVCALLSVVLVYLRDSKANQTQENLEQVSKTLVGGVA